MILKWFSQAISYREFALWHNTMKDELNSIVLNRVWDFVELPNGAKALGCKWGFKQRMTR